MKDEIKEILNQLEKVKDGVGTFIGIDNKGAKLLLDYITNLQTIEQQYSAILSENAELQRKNYKLQDKLEQHRKEYQETYKDVRIEIKEKDEIITNLQEEIERLNNIINELEKLLKQELDTIRNDEFFCNLTNEDYIEFILDKLKELKESDKDD